MLSIQFGSCNTSQVQIGSILDINGHEHTVYADERDKLHAINMLNGNGSFIEFKD